MLARLANMSTALREWELHFETPGGAVSVLNDRNVLVVDLQALRSLVQPLDSSDFTLQHLAGDCGRAIAPVYHSLHNMIKSDFKHVVEVLAELEHLSEAEVADVLDEHAQRKQLMRRNSSSYTKEAEAGFSSQPMIPKIIITPCGPREQDSLCRVPFQNSAFGDQLTVPGHPVFNHTFPPLAPLPCTFSALQDWTWRSGHWQATLPSIYEQERRGLFSKALVKRRKTRCTRNRP
ncbi:hypothetical protein FPV67DRAFT_1467424 [Lyophyllum atratum]|nr:hypothetical protein FPV67DRAFT_1467424 [Lyophyllum atratum]